MVGGDPNGAKNKKPCSVGPILEIFSAGGVKLVVLKLWMGHDGTGLVCRAAI